ncbi:molybdopterin-guanine dinucleotide biosynthesis protein B [Infirmifilum lucidum]|uniref:Molybdopterin-guanine dinucleotide biosynthesis protein B n=1 Tax=Infirmifilum lucidum TaxID=2776706 RepID=A0A7L9FI84_9CREN|nr:molybdopterin-guanine dinucleotide biosynthesis protein B [Infirmifilum lucidum]QOJ78634.1 molybdopterin-guanine dinucleotide biosynthesis protein B [Infirmifilum lucidum]
MKAVAIIGFKNSGKTTVAEFLVRELKARGLRVAALKHAHGGITPYNDDSSRLYKAGADVSVALSEEEAVEYKRGKPALWQYISSLRGYDFLVVEGFKDVFPGSRIVVARNVEEARQLSDSLVIAYTGGVARQATDASLPAPVVDFEREPERLVEIALEKSIEPLPALNCGFCRYGSCLALAEAIMRGEATYGECTVLASRVKLTVDGRPVELNPFVQDVFRNVVLGLVATLKGVEQNPRRVELSVSI